MATKITFKLGPTYLKDYNPPYTNVTDDDIKEKNDDEIIDELEEEFVDHVFDVESKLERKEFENNTLEKAPWILSSKEIRKKLGYS